MRNNTYDNIHRALIEINNFFNNPHEDRALIKYATVSLEDSELALIVRVSLSKTTNITKLAEQVGRDRTTVSRQITKLQSKGLIYCKVVEDDRRNKFVYLSDKGKGLVSLIKQGRYDAMDEIYDGWSERDLEEASRVVIRMARSMNKFSDKNKDL
jgi:DNA-binding MarR family transcriptional regulator